MAINKPRSTKIFRSGFSIGLQCALPITERGGVKLYDSSGKGSHGLMIGPMSFGPSKIGNALNGLTGGTTTTTYVDLGNLTRLNPTSPMTLAALIKPSALNGGNGENWVWGRDDDVNGRSYAFGYNSSQKLQLQINGAATIIGANISVVIGKWQLILATGDPVQGWIVSYNGVDDPNTAAWIAPNASTANTCLGRRTYTANQDGMVGSLGAAYFWNRSFSKDERAAIFVDPFIMFRRPSWNIKAGITPPPTPGIIQYGRTWFLTQLNRIWPINKEDRSWVIGAEDRIWPIN